MFARKSFVMLVRHWASAVAVLVLASACLAQSETPAVPAQAPMGNVDARLSRIYVRIGRLGWDHEHAAEGRLLGGNVRLGASENAGELVFDAASFIADTQDCARRVRSAGHDSRHDPREDYRADLRTPGAGRRSFSANRFPGSIGNADRRPAGRWRW